jgi:hypothetical protein
MSSRPLAALVASRHLIALVVGTSVIGCAVLLLVVGCSSGTSSEGPKKEQGHSEATTEQTRAAKAASEEARCEQTQPIDRHDEGWVTNNVPSCPKGGPLSGTDKPDKLDGLEGDDEIRGLGAKDDLVGGVGNDVIYGGPGNDQLKASDYQGRDPVKSKDVLYGGPGRDEMTDPSDKGDDVFYGGDGNDKLFVGNGEDVLYGGDGNDILTASGDGQRDKLYCGGQQPTGFGKDLYLADKIDYVDSSCEEKMVGAGA